MLKVEFWDEIKRAAKANTTDFRWVDPLLREYHQTPKVEPLKRLSVASRICEAARKVVAKSREFSGSRVAAEILLCAAEDTAERLYFDLEAAVKSQRIGKQVLALQKAHRHEALDPEHRRWALIAKDTRSGPGTAYKARRQEWRNHLMRVASDPSRAEQTIQKFYDFVGSDAYSEDPTRFKTKYYSDPDYRESRRLVFVRPGEQDNATRHTLVYRMTKRGVLKPYKPMGIALFVMLEGNRFYAVAERSTDQGVRHHSGLANAEPILGGGGMKFLTAGELLYVTQQSGHYHPTPTQFLETLSALDENGIDLAPLIVHAYTYFNHPPKPDQDPNSLLPALKQIEASYYLETEGRWATDRRVYRDLRCYQPAVQQQAQAVQLNAGNQNPNHDVDDDENRYNGASSDDDDEGPYNAESANQDGGNAYTSAFPPGWKRPAAANWQNARQVGNGNRGFPRSRVKISKQRIYTAYGDASARPVAVDEGEWA